VSNQPELTSLIWTLIRASQYRTAASDARIEEAQNTTALEHMLRGSENPCLAGASKDESPLQGSTRHERKLYPALYPKQCGSFSFAAVSNDKATCYGGETGSHELRDFQLNLYFSGTS
jgi:hypothetical protein